MKTAVIYARYSSDSQSEQSIEGQLRVCHQYAKNNDIVIIDTYIDRAMTGTNDSRPDFQKMLRDSNKKAWDYIIVYKLDRFARNKYESVIHKRALKNVGVRVISATESIPNTPEGIILESLLEGMAEYYSAELSQKVSRGMNENRQKGLYTGGVILYGYKVVNKKVEIDEDQAKIVREIYENYAAGIYVKDIIEELNNKGILNHGKPFARNTVYNILKNEKYSGIYKYGDEVFTNIYPQIVPDHIYKIVRQKVESNKFGKHDSNVEYLLRFKVKCGYCGSNIISDSGTSKNGEVKRYYKCSGRKHKTTDCLKTMIRKELLEKLIVDTTFKIFDNAETVTNIANKLFKIHQQRIQETSTLNILLEEQKTIQSSIDNLLSCMEQGIVTNSTKARLQELESQLDVISGKILIEQSKQKMNVTKEDIIKYIRTSLKKDAKQIIRLLIKEVVLFDDKVEIYYNYIDNRKRPDDNHQAFSFYTDTFKTIIDKHRILCQPSKIVIKIECFI